MHPLADKTAFITGASKGIGEATARHFANLGAKVILTARSLDLIHKIADEIVQEGGQALAISCDVADNNAVVAAIKKAQEAFGPIDVLVNNAGLIEPISRIEDSDPAQWGHVIDVNVKGVYQTTRAALPQMKTNGGGVIINISSGAATSALEGWSHYCASKAAALMLTKAIHKEESENGIRVVGLSPGTVATDMQVAIKTSGINPVSELDPSVHIPPLWVAKAIAWLATDDAQAYDGDDVSLRDDNIRKTVGLI